jgi:nudix-type nucleoside diphosphatase (YffH/AdpP family)
MKRVEIDRKQLIFNDFFKIEEVYLSYEKHDGEMTPILRLLNFERGDSVAALVWHKEWRKILLIKQFRYPTLQKGPGWILELIAGGLKEGEDPEEAVLRELEEEIGYKASSATFLSQFYVSPGGTSERILLYWVEVSENDHVRETTGLEEEFENIAIEAMTVAEMQQAVADGTICDAKTLLAFLYKQSDLSRL